MSKGAGGGGMTQDWLWTGKITEADPGRTAVRGEAGGDLQAEGSQLLVGLSACSLLLFIKKCF